MLESVEYLASYTNPEAVQKVREMRGRENVADRGLEAGLEEEPVRYTNNQEISGSRVRSSLSGLSEQAFMKQAAGLFERIPVAGAGPVAETV